MNFFVTEKNPKLSSLCLGMQIRYHRQHPRWCWPPESTMFFSFSFPAKLFKAQREITQPRKEFTCSQGTISDFTPKNKDFTLTKNRFSHLVTAVNSRMKCSQNSQPALFYLYSCFIWSLPDLWFQLRNSCTMSTEIGGHLWGSTQYPLFLPSCLQRLGF